MSHFDWDKVKRKVGTDVLLTQEAYVRGYIVALEDVIKETEDMGPWDSRMRLLENRDSAREILEHLNKIKKETP